MDGSAFDRDVDCRELLEDAARAPERPPVVEQDLERSPHRDPAPDHEPFARDQGEGILPGARDHFRQREARRHEHETDNQAGASPLHELAELAPRQIGAVREEVVDSVADERAVVVGARRLVQVDHEAKRRPLRILSRPAQDELFDVVVEILHGEWSGIHGVEQLANVVQIDRDRLGLFGLAGRHDAALPGSRCKPHAVASAPRRPRDAQELRPAQLQAMNWTS